MVHTVNGGRKRSFHYARSFASLLATFRYQGVADTETASLEQVARPGSCARGASTGGCPRCRSIRRGI